MSFLAQPCILLRLAQALINMSEHVQSKGLCPNWDSLELWRGGVPLVHNNVNWVKKVSEAVFEISYKLVKALTKQEYFIVCWDGNLFLLNCHLWLDILWPTT